MANFVKVTTGNITQFVNLDHIEQIGPEKSKTKLIFAANDGILIVEESPEEIINQTKRPARQDIEKMKKDMESKITERMNERRKERDARKGIRATTT